MQPLCDLDAERAQGRAAARPPSFEEFAWTASLYRDREQGRALVRKWAERHGGDVEELIRLARVY
jgi:hypothetical protein